MANTIHSNLANYNIPIDDDLYPTETIEVPSQLCEWLGSMKSEVKSMALARGFGETCHRAFYANGYHILLCSRRFFAFGENGHFYFPPFEGIVNDVCMDNIDENHTLVLVATTKGIHACTLELSTLTVIGTATFLSTAPISRIHRLTANIFGLCFTDASTSSLRVLKDEQGSYSFFLGASPSWMKKVSSLFSTDMFVDSLFDEVLGFLFVLSAKNVTAWRWNDLDGGLLLIASTSVPTGAVALSPSVEYNAGAAASAVLVMSNGRKLYLLLKTANNQKGEKMDLFLQGQTEIHNRATCCGVQQVSIGCQITAMYDVVMQRLVFSTKGGPHLANTPTSTEVATHIGARQPIVGLCFIEDENHDGGKFIAYTEDHTALVVEVYSKGYVLRKKLSDSASSTRLLKGLKPNDAVVMLFEAFRSSPQKEVLYMYTNTHMRPELASDRFKLSPCATGLLEMTLRKICLASRLCSAAYFCDLPKRLLSAKKELQCLKKDLTELLHQGAWLDCPAKCTASWENITAICTDKLTLSEALNEQGRLFSVLLQGVEDSSTICWLYGLLLTLNQKETLPDSLEVLLWAKDTSEVIEKLADSLVSSGRLSVIEKLLEGSWRLTSRSRILAEVQVRMAMGQVEECIQFIAAQFKDVQRYNLFDDLTECLESKFPEHNPRLQLLLKWHKQDQGAFGKITKLLENSEDYPVDNLTPRLKYVLLRAKKDSHLRESILSWITSVPIGDRRLTTFATILLEMNIQVDPEVSPSGLFLASWYQKARGTKSIASQGFLEIARSAHRVPLDIRLICVEYAINCDPNAVHATLTQYVLLLQKELSGLVREHASSNGPLIFPFPQIEADLDSLSYYFLDEKPLFEAGNRYRSLGGAKIQLDILRTHTDSPDRIVSEVTIAILGFLITLKLTPCDAVVRVLSEYYSNFATAFPLASIVEFLCDSGVKATSLASVLTEGGVPPENIFNTLLAFLDERDRSIFPRGEIIRSLMEVLTKVTALRQRSLFSSHLLERIRSLLSGEFRSVSLTTEETDYLRETERNLQEFCRLSMAA